MELLQLICESELNHAHSTLSRIAGDAMMVSSLAFGSHLLKQLSFSSHLNRSSTCSTHLSSYFLLNCVLGFPVPNDNAVGLVCQFPNETAIENLAVRQNGEILYTSINCAPIYLS